MYIHPVDFPSSQISASFPSLEMFFTQKVVSYTKSKGTVPSLNFAPDLTVTLSPIANFLVAVVVEDTLQSATLTQPVQTVLFLEVVMRTRLFIISSQ